MLYRGSGKLSLKGWHWSKDTKVGGSKPCEYPGEGRRALQIEGTGCFLCLRTKRSVWLERRLVRLRAEK